MGLGANILILREKKLLSQEQLAEEIGVTRQTVSLWEKEKLQPTKAKLERIAMALEVTIAQLYSNDVTKNITSVKVSKEGEDKLIPLYDTIAAGGTRFNSSMDAVQEPSDWIYPGTWFKDGAAAVVVYGDSMWPKYPNGCRVICREVQDWDLILWGQVYIIETSEYRVLKRLQKGKEDGWIRADSDNTVKGPSGKEIHEHMDIPKDKISRLFLVIGRAERVQA